jgi:hypothetical protein
VIAEQDGIKPEEVTFQRIRFEIAGLLPFYPAITMVPADKPNAGIPAPPTAIAEPTQDSTPQSGATETLAAQIQRLRQECRWSVEKLSEINM